MNIVEIKVHEIATDGLPNMEELTNRVAFIWDGNIISGWPTSSDTWGLHRDEVLWEGSEDRFGGPYSGVTHWIEFPTPFGMLKDAKTPELDVKNIRDQAMNDLLDGVSRFGRKHTGEAFMEDVAVAIGWFDVPLHVIYDPEDVKTIADLDSDLMVSMIVRLREWRKAEDAEKKDS